MIPVHTAEVIERRTLTSVVRHIVLRVLDAPAFSFRPGQFIQFILAPRTLRTFSIASQPSELPLLELCADISPMGPGSRFIDALRPGDRASFRGPFGVFTIPEKSERPLEFVATGAGIAPMRAMIPEAFRRTNPDPPSITLTFGCRAPADVLYDDEWRELMRRQPSFRYLPALSQPSPDWAGLRGRVTDVLPLRQDEFRGRVFYLCGSPEMVDDSRRLLRSLGIPDADVRFEKFY